MPHRGRRTWPQRSGAPLPTPEHEITAEQHAEQGKRRRRPPGLVEQARRRAWGDYWGGILHERKLRKARR